ncbi:UNVERIFIED_CONTAM: T9SS type B sorting domain-containing protein, partial [Ralstonia mannitolilytica]
TRTIEVTQAGSYTVTISNGVCSKLYSAQVSYTQVPDILEVIYENDHLQIKVRNNENIPLEFSIDGGVLWQNSDTFYNVNKNTEYAVRVRNVGTLCDTSVQYYTFFLPNAFTPNGDGINDVISFKGIAKFRNFSAIIVDRYGHQIFKATENNAVWDGKYLNNSVPTGSYWYTISWEDSITGKLI